MDTHFDRALIDRYDTSGPRYTSYPTALQFGPSFDSRAYRAAARSSNHSASPLSLYVHLPFCARLCHYCACNKIVTNKRDRAATYLDRVESELALQAALFNRARPIQQLHWGGGTPNFLSDAEMTRLMDAIAQYFAFADPALREFGIELDIRELGTNTLAHLHTLGFNRLSLGVQDLDPQVQKAVNRIQSEELLRSTMHEARRHGFRSISFDLIYGLPFQSVATMQRTLDSVTDIAPDRIAIYNYAHLPARFPTQARIRNEDLPDARGKLDLLELCIQRLTDAGYVYIGMDHFAKPYDDLVTAQQTGTLTRNFQGYSTHGQCDLIGVGVSAISSVGGTYAQNEKDLDAYQRRIDVGDLAVCQGLDPDPEDRLRRAIINALICHFTLSIPAIERDWQVQFWKHFDAEADALTAMQRDGLVTIDDERIGVTAKGRYLIRNICMVFDRHLPVATARRYSRVI